MDPALFVEKACSEVGVQESLRILIKHQGAVPRYSHLVHCSKQLFTAVRIINAVKNEWILTGRRHIAISAAALVMAMEALGT